MNSNVSFYVYNKSNKRIGKSHVPNVTSKELVDDFLPHRVELVKESLIANEDLQTAAQVERVLLCINNPNYGKKADEQAVTTTVAE